MPLNYTPIYRNLGSRIKVLYFLELEDLMVIIILACVGGFIGNWIPRQLFGWLDLNIFLQYIVPIIAVPFLILFKYNKPKGYFGDLIRFYIRTPIYSPGGRDDKHAIPYFKYADE